MNSATSSYSRKILDFLLKGTTLALDGSTATWGTTLPLWLGLFTSNPTEAGGGTEVSGNGYVRLALTAATDWASATTANDITYSTLATAKTFAVPSASWGTITSVGIFDAATGGTLLLSATLETPTLVSSGSAPVIATGTSGIKVTLN